MLIDLIPQPSYPFLQFQFSIFNFLFWDKAFFSISTLPLSPSFFSLLVFSPPPWHRRIPPFNLTGNFNSQRPKTHTFPQHYKMHYHSLLQTTFLLLLLLSAAAAASHRRLLHQPLFPLAQSQPPTTSSISNPPYPSPAPLPQPQTAPKYPFSTLPPPDTTPQNPFFPFFPSPPPPPPPPPAPSSSAAFPTFPANISSLVIPASSHPSHAPTKLISLIISISLFSTLVFVSILILLRRHHHHHHHHHPLKSDSLRLFPPNTAPSDTSSAVAAVDPTKKPPPPLFPRHTSTSTSSSEFLYLGTLVSSRDADYSGPIAAAAAQLDAKSSPIPPAAASLNYQRLGSPELQPLPPLPRQQCNQTYNNTTTTHVTSSEGDENDREDDDEFFSPRESTGNNASPHRTRLSPKPKPFNSLTANSPTYSISPDNSPSAVLNSGSPQSLLSKSPDSSVTFPAPIARFIPPPPAREPRPFSPFSPSSTDDCGTRDCSPRPSDFSSAGAVPVAPPPPPARFWERVPTSGPPELVAPSRKASKSEEMAKPKLKALHWDKVRASSDRAMVWDQLKSSSFQ